MEAIPPRAPRGPKPKGQDMRVVAEILKQLSTKFGRRNSRITILRLTVLAWVHITPTQLMQVDPLKDFHDVPDATRDEILDGLITLTIQPRRKGKKNRPLPAPQVRPLNLWGVEALRAFAAEPKAWGVFSLPSANKLFKRACVRAQKALADRGVIVDLSEMSLYHMKHSRATAETRATHGAMKDGQIQQSVGLSQAMDHTSTRTTAIYTQAAAAPLLCQANRTFSLWLEDLFRHPLAAPPLRLVANQTPQAASL